VNVWAGIYLDRDFIILQKFQLGKKVNVAKSFPSIKNSSKYIQKCKVSFKNPSQYKRGYNGLPDFGWIATQQKTLVLNPNQELKLQDFYFFVPAEERNYNQHFQTLMTIETDEHMALSISVPIWIETESKKPNLPGFNGLYPSSIEFGKGGIKREQRSVYVYNQETKPVLYTIFVFTPPKRSGWAVMPPSAGYEWLGRVEGITIEAKGRKITDTRWEILIKPKSAMEIKLRTSPDYSLKGKEAFLVAVAENYDEWNFSRIQIKP